MHDEEFARNHCGGGQLARIINRTELTFSGAKEVPAEHALGSRASPSRRGGAASGAVRLAGRSRRSRDPPCRPFEGPPLVSGPRSTGSGRTHRRPSPAYWRRSRGSPGWTQAVAAAEMDPVAQQYEQAFDAAVATGQCLEAVQIRTEAADWVWENGRRGTFLAISTTRSGDTRENTARRWLYSIARARFLARRRRIAPEQCRRAFIFAE
jgi:hypothetical protein